MSVQEDAAAYEVLQELETLHPLSEYHEDMGDVLWWKVPITEAPWVGSPNCLGHTVQIEVTSLTNERVKFQPRRSSKHTFDVGGWLPRYYTHWSPLPKVKEPPRHGPPTPRT